MKELQLKNLNAHHGQLCAVNDVTLQIPAGQCAALCGANGSGKSTLLRTIAGAHRQCTGSVSFDRKNISLMPAALRSKQGISLVPEGRRVFAEMSVWENLLVGAHNKRDGRWTPDTILQLFPNLVKRRHTRTGLLSGGEQQATAIGRALVNNPDLLLLDEVSLGLSPLAVDLVYQSLEQLRDIGVTIVLVEQDLSRTLNFSDRVICMCEGRIVLDCDTQALSREQITSAYFGMDASTRSGIAAC